MTIWQKKEKEVMKLCKDCKWYLHLTDSRPDRCLRPQNDSISIDLVTGEKKAVFCSLERMDLSYDIEDPHCGTEARYFISRGDVRDEAL